LRLSQSKFAKSDANPPLVSNVAVAPITFDYGEKHVLDLSVMHITADFLAE
jgi:hypothetical protein